MSGDYTSLFRFGSPNQNFTLSPQLAQLQQQYATPVTVPAPQVAAPIVNTGTPVPGYNPGAVMDASIPTGKPGAPGGNWWDGFVGTKDQPGWGGLGISAAQGLFNGYMAMKSYGLAKDTFDENRRQFAEQMGLQKQNINSQLEDRQRARVASNSGAYQSVGDYMKQNRLV